MVAQFNKKTLLAHVYSSTGVYIKTWNDISDPPIHSWPINAGPGAIQLQLPRVYGATGEPGEGGADDLFLDNIVKLMVVDSESGVNGVQLHSGALQQYSLDLEKNLVTDVALVPKTSLLGDVTVRGPITFVATDPTDMMHYFVTNGYLPGVTWDAGSPLVGVAFNQVFESQKLGQIFDTIRLLAGSRWFYRFNRDDTLTFNQWSDTPTHILEIGKHIMGGALFNRSNIDMKKRVYVFGVPDAVDSLGVFHPGITVEAHELGYDPTVYPRDLFYSNPRITAIDLANRIATTLLDYYSQSAIGSLFTVLDSNYCDTGFGYDLETLKPGDSVIVLNPNNIFSFPIWGIAGLYGSGVKWGGTWQAQVQRTMVIANIDYNYSSAVVQLENRLPQTDEALINVADRLLLAATSQ